MGNAASKAASAAPKAAATAGRRQYPSSPSILNSATSTSNSPSTQNQSTQAPPSAFSLGQQQYNSAPPSSQPSSQVHPDPRTSPPSDTRSQHIDLDGRDPQFASSLRKLGPAVSVDRSMGPSTQSFPTSSRPPVGQHGQNIFPSSPPASPSTAPISNASLRIVQARDRIAARFAEESENMGRASFGGRSLINAKEVGEVLRLTVQGRSDVEIEKQLRLKPGIVRELVGPRGLVDNV